MMNAVVEHVTKETAKEERMSEVMYEPKPPQVYLSMAEAMGELAKVGIGKNNKNTQQGYKFRGIDDVYNALAPILAKHKLLILPRVLSRTVTERETKNGSVLFYVVLDMEFDIVSGIDGSKHTIKVCGEAMDSGDKATNKAMSAAYKYACIEAFCIPTEGDNDADATTHEVKAVTPPEGYESWKADMAEVAEDGTEALQDAWKRSSPELRSYAVKHDLQWWNATKDVAERNKCAA